MWSRFPVKRRGCIAPTNLSRSLSQVREDGFRGVRWSGGVAAIYSKGGKHTCGRTYERTYKFGSIYKGTYKHTYNFGSTDKQADKFRRAYKHTYKYTYKIGSMHKCKERFGTTYKCTYKRSYVHFFAPGSYLPTHRDEINWESESSLYGCLCSGGSSFLWTPELKGGGQLRTIQGASLC